MSFSPISLFGGGEQGVIYDVQTLSSMFQDVAGTVEAVVDGPVGRINDLSGNGNHATQAIEANRPTLRHSGAYGYYLEGDGVNDQLVATFAITQPFTRVSQVEQVGSTNVHMVFAGATNFNGSLRQGPSSAQLLLNSGTNSATTSRLFLNTPGLVTEVHNGTSSELGIGRDTREAIDAGTNAPGGISLLGSGAANNLEAQANLYGVVMVSRVLTAEEIESTQWWLTSRYTRVLVVDGDSMTYADGNGTGWAWQYLARARPLVFMQNLAIPGTGLDTNIPNDLVTTTRDAQIDVQIPANKRGQTFVYVPWWSNQAPNGGYDGGPARTTSEWAAAAGAFIAGKKSIGYDRVAIGTLLERTDPGSSNVLTRGPYNDLIRTPAFLQTWGIDYLIDFAANPIMGAVGASADTALFSDRVHPTVYGNSILAGVAADALNTPVSSVYLRWR